MYVHGVSYRPVPVFTDAKRDAQRHPVGPRDHRGVGGQGRGGAYPCRPRHRRPQRASPGLGADGVGAVRLRCYGEGSVLLAVRSAIGLFVCNSRALVIGRLL